MTVVPGRSFPGPAPPPYARPVGAVERLQERLAPVLALDAPGSTTEHVVVALPSFSMSAVLLDRYRWRLAALEHRSLNSTLQVGRVPGAHVVIVTCEDPRPEVLDYYAALAAPHDPGARERISCLVVPDDTARGVAAKLLDRPDLVERLRGRIGGRPACIEPWNVTEDEVRLAVALDVPLDGSPPRLWPLGFKSASRRLFRAAGVPVPPGAEDVRSVEDVAAAVARLREEVDGLRRVVVKVDDCGSGHGNLVVTTRDDRGRPLPPQVVAERALRDAPSWFAAELASGGVVEELVGDGRVTSPSAQLDLLPGGEVRVVATHEQVLDGAQGQEFSGCTFPADGRHGRDLARHANAVGEALARAGALGRVSVDFVAADGPEGAGLWAVDLNLRKGGTTHPFDALRHLVPGHYDTERARWVADRDGLARCYRSSEALADTRWQGRDPRWAIEAVEGAGLAFDHDRGEGVVLHMLSALRVEGRVGLTAIATDHEGAAEMVEATRAALLAAAS